MMENTQTSSPEKTCPCGYDKSHYMVSPERKYTAWGWFLALVMNAGATPYRIEWKCRRCRTLIEASNDRDVCQAHRA